MKFWQEIGQLVSRRMMSSSSTLQGTGRVFSRLLNHKTWILFFEIGVQSTEQQSKRWQFHTWSLDNGREYGIDNDSCFPLLSSLWFRRWSQVKYVQRIPKRNHVKIGVYKDSGQTPLYIYIKQYFSGLHRRLVRMSQDNRGSTRPESQSCARCVTSVRLKLVVIMWIKKHT